MRMDLKKNVLIFKKLKFNEYFDMDDERSF